MMLTAAIQDRMIMIGLGIAAVGVVGIMGTMLVGFRNAAIIPPSKSVTKQIDQKVEDSLKTSTLAKLLNSSNYSIQEIAAMIVCERALHDDDTIDTLLWHITRSSYTSREQGIRALVMIMNSSTIAFINKPQTYAALVRCLEYSIDDYQHNKYDPHWDNWYLRDVVEQDCLQIINLLVDTVGVQGLIKSRFVQRWLAKEPWGPDPQSSFLQSLASNDRLSSISRSLFRDPAARDQLKHAKLLPPHTPGLRYSDVDVRMVDGEGTAGEDVAASFIDSRRPRHRDQSIEEEHLRRRHREAMVFNDGTRPVERGDIIERER